MAVDDTDSPKWMCTTYLATKLIEALPDQDLIGMPRLVRLNPAVPWKTRGNGAICLRFGKGKGMKRQIGSISSHPIYAYPDLKEEPCAEEVLSACGEVVEKWSQKDDSDSGLVVSGKQPPVEFYRRAVTTILAKQDAEEYLKESGAISLEWGEGRGIIGAGAAMAWRPMDRTYEVLAYRAERRWGTEREVRAEDVRELDRRFPHTFNNYDREVGRPAIVPHSSCPVLYGIRGDSALELIKAKDSIRSETVDRWLLFISNQGTDDHIIRSWESLIPNSSYEIEGEVVSTPKTHPGGYVIFKLRTTSGEEIDCTAYEPSKSFRETIRGLRPGDKITVLGELREEPRTLNLEKIKVLSLSASFVKKANPSCPKCERKMKSIGRGQGYRCRDCGTKSLHAELVPEKRTLQTIWYEPPVCARRHLSKPLKRLHQPD